MFDKVLNYRRLYESNRPGGESESWDKLNLSYRSTPKLNAIAQKNTVVALTWWLFMALVVAIFGIAAGPLLFQADREGKIFIVLLAFFGAAACWGFFANVHKAGQYWKLFFIITGAIAFLPIPIALLAVFVGRWELRAGVGFFITLALFILADRIVRHHYYWILANPECQPEAKEMRAKWFQKRWIPFGLVNARRELRESCDEAFDKLQELPQKHQQELAQHQAEVKRLEEERDSKNEELQRNLKHAKSILVNLPATQKAELDQVTGEFQRTQTRLADLKYINAYKRPFLVLFPIYCTVPHLPQRWLAFSILLLPPLLAFAWLFLFAFRLGLKKTLLAPFTALSSWITYGYDIELDTFLKPTVLTNDVPPGIFRSPSGTSRKRILFIGLVFIAFASVILPAVDFFLIPPEQFGGTLEGIDGTALTEKDLRNSTVIPWFKYVFSVIETQTQWLLAILFSFVASITFPLNVLYTIIVATGARMLAATYRSVELDKPHRAIEKRTDRTAWQVYVDRLQTAPLQREREHLWIGSHLLDDFPVLLDRRILTEHAYICGDSGSGKTTLGIIPIITQLLRMKDEQTKAPYAALVVLDLKGDNAMFQTTKAIAEAQNRNFYYFTNEALPSCYFNPFSQLSDQDVTVEQFCEICLEALGLSHGEGYGRSYFSRVARYSLRRALNENPGKIHSFEQLYELFNPEGKGHSSADQAQNPAFELISVIENLSTIKAINLVDVEQTRNKKVINMKDVIENKDVVYFSLPAALQAASVRELAKLALYSLLTAAYMVNRHLEPGQKAPQTFLVIDEFQRIAADNFKLVLQQARSMGVGTILANQAFADLKTADADLRPTIQTNTRCKLYFTGTDPNHVSDMIRFSGLRRVTLPTYNEVYHEVVEKYASDLTAEPWSDPRLGYNNIMEITDDPQAAYFHVARGSGYTQYTGFPLPVLTSYAVTEAEYKRLSRLPWPALDEQTVLNERRSDPPDSLDQVKQVYTQFDQSQEPSKDSAAEQPVGIKRTREAYQHFLHTLILKSKGEEGERLGHLSDQSPPQSSKDQPPVQ